MELPSHRISLYNKLIHPGQSTATSGTQQQPPTLHTKASNLHAQNSNLPSRTQTPVPREASASNSGTTPTIRPVTTSPAFQRRVSYATAAQQTGFVPVLESVDHAVKNTDLRNVHLPDQMTTDDFTRAVAVATVSALRHQQTHAPGRIRAAHEHEAAGGHDAPSWSRTTSASVLLACTALYAIIAGMF